MKKQSRIWVYSLLIIWGALVFTTSCKKDDDTPPETIFNPNLTYGKVSDIDGNEYKTITIGTQTWMAENLKVTKYRNGDVIGTTTPYSLDITYENTPKYEWAYEGNESNVTSYGRLYTWYTITDSRNVCPTGWHVPNNDEWSTLADYLADNGHGYKGSGGDIGKSMAARSGWEADTTAGVLGNDQASNNSSGFTALPGGLRDFYGAFHGIGSYGHWWTSNEFVDSYAFVCRLNYSYKYIDRYNDNKAIGYSVRCAKD